MIIFDDRNYFPITDVGLTIEPIEIRNSEGDNHNLRAWNWRA